ncbi:MAG: hypothetical protein R2681_16390 [Pyrinomonadaceae bacterium]
MTSKKIQTRKHSKAGINRRSPFWFPAPQYYLISAGVVLLSFFFLSWVFMEPGNEIPWGSAGFVALLLLAATVFLREVILKNEHHKYLAVTRRLDRNVRTATSAGAASKKKFSLGVNADVLEKIEIKSKAAQTLSNLPDAHLEVFEMCESYLNFTESELKRIDINSPRFGAVRRGRRRVRELHRYHVLTWASVESDIYTQAAKDCDTITGKVENAKKALNVLNTALEFYPREPELLESADLVKVTIASTEISFRIAEAEKAAENGEHGVAIGKYKDALFYLARENMENRDVAELAENIKIEIDRLRKIAED